MLHQSAARHSVRSKWHHLANQEKDGLLYFRPKVPHPPPKKNPTKTKTQLAAEITKTSRNIVKIFAKILFTVHRIRIRRKQISLRNITTYVIRWFEISIFFSEGSRRAQDYVQRHFIANNRNTHFYSIRRHAKVLEM